MSSSTRVGVFGYPGSVSHDPLHSILMSASTPALDADTQAVERFCAAANPMFVARTTNGYVAYEPHPNQNVFVTELRLSSPTAKIRTRAWQLPSLRKGVHKEVLYRSPLWNAWDMSPVARLRLTDPEKSSLASQLAFQYSKDYEVAAVSCDQRLRRFQVWVDGDNLAAFSALPFSQSATSVCYVDVGWSRASSVVVLASRHSLKRVPLVEPLWGSGDLVIYNRVPRPFCC